MSELVAGFAGLEGCRRVFRRASGSGRWRQCSVDMALWLTLTLGGVGRKAYICLGMAPLDVQGVHVQGCSRVRCRDLIIEPRLGSGAYITNRRVLVVAI